MRFVLKVFVLSLFISCSSDNRSLVYPDTAGLTYGESEQGFDNTVFSLREELNYAGFKLVRSFDLKSYAESYGRRSREAQHHFISKPELEIPLIQENPKVGIEFPSRLLTYVDKGKYVLVAYNSPEYLKLSYDLERVSSKVKDLDLALSEVVTRVTGDQVQSNSNNFMGNMLVSAKSVNTFDQTFNALRNAVLDHREFKELQVVDHKANAALIGEKIGANKVLIFTTGETEADMIDRFQISSVDLPLRFLVWEDNTGGVQVSWINLDAVGIRHKIDAKHIAKFDDIRRELMAIVASATAKGAL